MKRFWVFLPLAACTPPAPTPTPAPAVASVPKAPPAAEPDEPGDDGSSDPVLWQTRVDLDGDGRPENVRLTSPHFRSADQEHGDDPRIDLHFGKCDVDCEATLWVGEHSARLPVTDGYFGGVGIRTVDIDRSDSRRELVFTQRGGDAEDPPYLFWVALYDGGELRLQKLWSSNGYNSGAFKTDGDGTATVYYGECPDAFTVPHRLEGLALLQGAVKTERVAKPEDCAACPYVFVRHRNGWTRKGEILRGFRSPELGGRQSLRLANPHRFDRMDGVIRVELREEKPETTHLEAVWLEVDGARVDALGFSAAVLTRGQTIEIAFPVGALRPESDVRLWARGYYVPDSS